MVITILQGVSPSPSFRDFKERPLIPQKERPLIPVKMKKFSENGCKNSQKLIYLEAKKNKYINFGI